jgi:hypothetical protein
VLGLINENIYINSFYGGSMVCPPKGSPAGSLVPRVTALRAVDPLRGGDYWDVTRSQGAILLNGLVSFSRDKVGS